MEKLARDEHSSLLRKFVNYGQIFITLASVVKLIPSLPMREKSYSVFQIFLMFKMIKSILAIIVTKLKLMMPKRWIRIQKRSKKICN